MTVIIGIDPGVTDPSGIVTLRAGEYGRPSRVLAATVARLPAKDTTRLGKRSPGEQLATAARAGALTAATVIAARALHTDAQVVLEVYEDTGPQTKQSAGRYRLPYAIGVIWTCLLAEGITPECQTASQVLRPRAIGGYFRANPKLAAAAIEGYGQLTNDHLRAAAAHAEYFARARGSLGR